MIEFELNKLFSKAAINSSISRITNTFSVDTVTSSHTVSETSGSTDGVAELDGIRAVEFSAISVYNNRTFLLADDLVSSPVGMKDSVRSLSFASEGQTIRLDRASGSLRGGQVSTEALAAKTSAIDLLRRESGIVDTLRVFTVEIERVSLDFSNLDL